MAVASVRPRHAPQGIASVFALVLSCIPISFAHPYPKDDLHEAGFGYLMNRDCAQYCGYNNMYCCSSGSTCYTSNGIAGCSVGAGGGFAWYTTTWTETETFTSTFSSYWPAQTGSNGQDCVPPEGSGQIACGSICCASWQYCAYSGQCMANAGAGGSGGQSTYTTVISGTTITTQYSAPYRVTSGATVTSTATTGTAASETTSSSGNGTVTTGTSGHLSGGAIAGIVIGTLAGIAILLTVCFCCIVRGLWHTLLAILGLGKKKKHSRETIIEEERYSRHGSVHSRRDRHGGWFGGSGGGRASTVASRKEKKSSGTGWGLAAAAGTLMLLLGLRRDKKRKEARRARSEVSSSYFTESYTASSPSSQSSDRRTRQSRRSHRTRTTTRVSRAGSRA